MATHKSDKQKVSYWRLALVIIAALTLFALCTRIGVFSDGVERDPFRGVEGVFE